LSIFDNIFEKVLIATSEIMEWIETVLMEQEKMRSVFDINKSKVLISLDKLAITTTRRTTALVYVSLFNI